MARDDGSGTTGAPVAGWYPDPWSPAQRRYWDGDTWTAHAFPETPGSPGAANRPDPQVSPPWPTPTTGVSGDGPPPPQWWSPTPAPAAPAPTVPLDLPPIAPERPPGWWPPRGRTLVVSLIVFGFLVGILGGALIPRHNTVSPSANPRLPLITPPSPRTIPIRPAPSPDPAASVLAGLVLHQPDVGATQTVATIDGGTEVAGQTTLDLCNGTFPSEALRTARLQVAAVDDQGGVVISTEAVLYATPAAASQAFAELRSVAAGCPGTPVVSPVGEPTVITHFNPSPDGGWPQVATVQRAAYDFQTIGALGAPSHVVAAYLMRGRTLMGVYFSHPDGPQPPVAGQTTLAGIVNVFATRVAALTGGAVGG